MQHPMRYFGLDLLFGPSRMHVSHASGNQNSSCPMGVADHRDALGGSF